MGRADYYADGQWNFFCDFCGAKEKASKGEKTWNGYYVCRHHREARNSQDFVRGIKDNQSVPWTRPEAADSFVGLNPLCTINSNTAIPALAWPGCCYPGRGIEFATDFTLLNSAIAGIAIAEFAVTGQG